MARPTVSTTPTTPSTRPTAPAAVAAPVVAPKVAVPPVVKPPVLIPKAVVKTPQKPPEKAWTQPAQEEVEPVEIATDELDYVEYEDKLNRKDRRRLNRSGKPKASDEPLKQKIEAMLLVALAKKYPENKEIIHERDLRISPKKVKKVAAK